MLLLLFSELSVYGAGPFHCRLRKKMVSYAESLMGVPYKYGGTDPSGFDCSGYTGYVYAHFHKNLPRDSRAQYAAGRSLKRLRRARPGDLIFFTGRDASSGEVGHSGLILSREGSDIVFIHSSSSKGIIKSRLSEPYYRDRYIGCRKFF